MKRHVTKEKKNSPILLIYLCWLVYACSYIGKMNYAANINPIMDSFGISHAEAGLVSTVFFFSYGIGQVVNGLFCKKYNIKWIVFSCLLVSGVINLLIPILPSFAPIKYLWVINGFTLSVLWPTLIRLLSESLSGENLSRAILVMGSTVAAGTLFCYCTSAFFMLFTSFRAAFFTAAIVLLAVGFIWIYATPQLMSDCKKIQNEVESDSTAIQTIENAGYSKRTGSVLFLIATLALFGVITNLIKDGLTTWVPSILKESYSLDDSLSIILTLALPIVSISGNELAVALHKKIPNYVTQCALMSLLTAAIIGAVIFSLELDSVILTLVCFTAVSLLVSSTNSLITSLFPLYMKGRLNSGLIAGILNGFCYLGSTISSYGLGLVADLHGWIAVFITLLIAAAISLVGAVVYAIVARGKNNRSIQAP